MVSFCHLEEGGKQNHWRWFLFGLFFCSHLQSLPRAVPAAYNSWYFMCQKFTKPPAFSWVSIAVLIWACQYLCCTNLFTQGEWFLNIGVLAVLLQKQDLFAFIVFRYLLWVQNVYVTVLSLKIGNHAAVKLPCVNLYFPMCGHTLFFPSRGVCACMYAVCIFLIYILCINLHVYT